MIGLACSTLSCDGFGDSHFVKTFEILPQIGYRFVEFNCWHPGDLTPAGVASIGERCQASGLAPAAVYGSSFGGNNNHELSKDVCHKLRMIEAAQALGCRRIVATGARRGQQGGLDAILTVLREIVPVAEEQGVLVCLENHANNNLETLDDYARIFDAIDSPALGLCVDTGHFDAAGVALDAVVDRFATKINHIHVKEAAAKGVERFVPFGQGVTDNHRLLDRLVSAGYKGYISVEFAQEDKSNLLRDLGVPYEQFKGYER
jgi:sugar phosphate isomerase/epimerase